MGPREKFVFTRNIYCPNLIHTFKYMGVNNKENRIDGIYIPLRIGDIIYTGRFRNKKTTVKTIGKDEYGMPTVNGKRVMNFRILPEDKKN